MRSMRIGAIALACALGACATGSGTTPAAQIQQVLQTIQPVESALACTAQAGCNATTAAAELAGDKGVSGSAQLCSIAAGTFCNGLSAGALLPTPVPVAGTITVPSPTGPLAVPAPAVPTS
jgi:hypothetical protein